MLPEFRRRGIGRNLTQVRLDWIRQRDSRAYYFANIRNQASIDLHRRFSFVEVTRDFIYPSTSFVGGVGALFRVDLNR